MLTSIVDTDRYLLEHLSFKSLINICIINKYFNQLVKQSKIQNDILLITNKVNDIISNLTDYKTINLNPHKFLPLSQYLKYLNFISTKQIYQYDTINNNIISLLKLNKYSFRFNMELMWDNKNGVYITLTKNELKYIIISLFYDNFI